MMKNKLITIAILMILAVFIFGCTQQDNNNNSPGPSNSPPIDNPPADNLLSEISDADLSVEESGADEVMNYEDVIPEEIS